jgi:hypothetical protein
MKHDFHFVLTIQLKEYIINFASMNNMSLSETIVHIINTMKPFINKHYYKDMKCKIGKYDKIGADSDMHVYLEHNEYRYLKQVKTNLNIFSTALIIRWLLEEFFIGLIKYGIEDFLKMVTRYNQIHGLRTKKRWVTKHMLYQQPFVQVVFNDKYQLLSIEFS